MYTCSLPEKAREAKIREVASDSQIINGDEAASNHKTGL
jgi:hypothetical protein